MDKYLTVIRSTVCDITGTYFEAQLYRYPTEGHLYKYPEKKTKNQKLSRIIVESKGKELINRTLSESEVKKLFSSLEQIKFKLDTDNGIYGQQPEVSSELKIKSVHFNLVYKWTTDGIYGNRTLERSLTNVLETLDSILENDSFELDLPMIL